MEEVIGILLNEIVVHCIVVVYDLLVFKIIDPLSALVQLTVFITMKVDHLQ